MCTVRATQLEGSCVAPKRNRQIENQDCNCSYSNVSSFQYMKEAFSWMDISADPNYGTHKTFCIQMCKHKIFAGQGKIWTEYAMLISSQRSSIYFPKLRVWSRVPFWKRKGQLTERESLCKMNIWIQLPSVLCSHLFTWNEQNVDINKLLTMRVYTLLTQRLLCLCIT